MRAEQPQGATLAEPFPRPIRVNKTGWLGHIFPLFVNITGDRQVSQQGKAVFPEEAVDESLCVLELGIVRRPVPLDEQWLLLPVLGPKGIHGDGVHESSEGKVLGVRWGSRFRL